MEKQEQIQSAIFIQEDLKIIRLDKHCLALQKLKECRSRKDNSIYTTWDTIGYHGDIVSVFKQVQQEIFNDKLFEKELNGVEEIIEKVTDLKKQVVDIVKKSDFNI